MDRFEQQVESTAALADELRRRLYSFVRRQRRPVGREEAAEAVGISRKLAAFHLDKLVDKGLLTARYARLTGRSGPGAGRPAKVYEPSGAEVSVSIPSRSYAVMAGILVDAAGARASCTADAREAAFRHGEEAGRAKRRGRGRRAVEAILADRGYEPYADDRGALRLHNCPFHALARRSPELVCGINEAFIRGLLTGLGAHELEAILDPRPGECCVRIRSREPLA